MALVRAAKEITLERHESDRFGRSSVVARADSADAVQVLIWERLARLYDGHGKGSRLVPMKKRIPISKLDAATRQLETAIELLFQEKDPVSIHTLTMAAFGILRNLSERDPQNRMAQFFSDWVRPGMEGPFWRAINSAANFLKHADRDPDATLDAFDPVANDFLIMFGIGMCEELGTPVTPHFRIYWVWFGVEHPDLLKEGTALQAAIVASIQSLGRLDRKSLLLAVRGLLKQQGLDV